MNTRERLFLQYLYWRMRPSLAEKFISRKSIKKTGGVSGRGLVRVGAVQVKIKMVNNPLDYVDEMYRHVKKAAEAGVQLLAFPEYNCYQLFGLIPGIESAAAAMNSTGDEQPAIKVLDLPRFVSPPFLKFIYATFSCLARHFGLYLMAGSFPTPQGENIMNRSALFGPDGKLLGVQDKIHLMPKEHEVGLTAGNRFNVIETEFGRLAMPVCMDATYFETFRILEAAGAEIVFLPIADASHYNYWLAMRGIWPRVQESLFYGVKAALVGEFLGDIYTGKAGVFAPLELTPNKDGVLAEAESFDGDDLVAADLNLEALRQLKADHPYLGDKNPQLTRKYFPSIYESVQVKL